MRNREEVAQVVIKIISDEGHVYRRFGESATLKSDLDIDTDYYKDIKKALNKKYSLELTKSDIKDCVDVEDVIDLVYGQLNNDIDISDIDNRVKRIIYYECSNVKTYSLEGDESLKRDLYIDDDEYRDIKEELNNRYNLDLKKKDIKQCTDVQDVVDLVSERLGVGKATVVHIWYPDGNGRVGHSSLELRDGTYISFWPKDDSVKNDVITNTSHVPKYHNYGMDYKEEGGRHSLQIHIKSTREDLIKNQWRKIRSEVRRYHLQKYNCSTVVAELLYVGTGKKPSFQEEYEHNTNIFGIKIKGQAWHPGDIAKYAKELQ